MVVSASNRGMNLFGRKTESFFCTPKSILPRTLQPTVPLACGLGRPRGSPLQVDYGGIALINKANHVKSYGQYADNQCVARIHRRGGVYPRPTSCGQDSKQIYRSSEDGANRCIWLKFKINAPQLRGRGLSTSYCNVCDFFCQREAPPGLVLTERKRPRKGNVIPLRGR